MPIEFEKVSFVYEPKSPFRHDALRDVDLLIEEGVTTAIVGKTGSGKSTLIQHMNALLNPTSGKVKVGDFVNSSAKKERSKDLFSLRKRVGMVFQFPEYQLFEDTVEKDVAFGPRNFGASKEEALKMAHEALIRVGLDESFFGRSPFQLSGGEKRKAAIAGVLATKPSILVLDEPTSGLDPASAEETMQLFEEIKKEGTTLILVTHDMDLVLRHADKVVVMDEGKVVKVLPPEELFLAELGEYSLDMPKVYSFARKLQERGWVLDMKGVRDVAGLAKAIKNGRRSS